MSALPLPDLAQCASETIRVPGAIQQDRRRSAEAGFAAHLVKPADPAEVHARLTQVPAGAGA